VQLYFKTAQLLKAKLKVVLTLNFGRSDKFVLGVHPMAIPAAIINAMVNLVDHFI
jgi:hypothetical protein